ncbi:MAG: hypothetical protein A2234_03275 [Elusimicrobia bacterium RIFOXYA2_FULL_58_8]|nr:MAG: hypothetical protein A2234_03275 [Elusimicrobia bacterium RIFOXYA2_FULL_58_8]
MDKSELEKEISSALSGLGFELVDLRIASHNGKPLLQVFADRENGNITLDECGTLSEKVGEFLDAGNVYENGYFLEVSSPGVDRVIKTEKDFRRFMSRQVKVKLKRPVNGARVHYGAIAGFENGELALSGGLKFSLGDIEEARLHPADDEILHKGK